MSDVNADATELLQIAQNMQNAVNSIEATKSAMTTRYQQLGENWNDKKYKELGDIVRECNKALNNILNTIFQGIKYVLQLTKLIQEYNAVNFAKGGTRSASHLGVNQILQTSLSSNQVYSQTEHRKLIVSRDNQIVGIMQDIKNGSGNDISKIHAEELLDSLHNYSGCNYKVIRYAYNNPNAPIRLQNDLNNIDEYINSAPKWHGTTYRGINVSRNVAQQIRGMSVIDMLGPSSWSTSEEIAQCFSNRDESVRMIFVLSNNVSGASITHLATYNGSEEEVLSPSQARYIPDRIEETAVNGERYVYVHVHEQIMISRNLE